MRNTRKWFKSTQSLESFWQVSKLPGYTTRKFIALLSLAVIAAVLIVFVASPALNYFFPSRRVYQQLVVYDAQQCGSSVSCFITSAPWVRINHTLVVTGNQVESTIAVSALLEPSPSPDNVTIITEFDPVDNLVPTFRDGNLSWRGELHQGQTIELTATFAVGQDGRYYISGAAFSSAPDAIYGGRSTYYLFVENGVVARVSDGIDVPLTGTTRVKDP